MSGNYSIVEAQLPLIGGLAGHDLLVVLDSNGNVVGEMDGLATGSNGQIKPIGYLPSDTLKTYSYKSKPCMRGNPVWTVRTSIDARDVEPFVHGLLS